RNPEQAQDLVQDTYVRALRYQHSFEAGTNMKAWLFAIMRNLFWDRFKSSHKDDVSLDDVGDFPLYDKLKDSAQIPEAQVLDQLKRFVDRELSDTEVAELQHHMSDCPPCEDRYHFQAELKRLIRVSCCQPESNAPESLRSKLREILS